MMATMTKTEGILLSTLLEGFTAVSPAVDREVTGITIDSRKVSAGDLFLAYREGEKYITEAINAGACAVAVDRDNLSGLSGLTVPVFHINELNSRTGIIASRFYGDPSSTTNIIGVTGTNGKTSVSYLLAQCLSTKDESCGLLGSLGYGTIEALDGGLTTTPDPETLQRLLYEMRCRDITRVAMEVSSHSLDQCRVAGVKFEIGVFTNLSREHLDYHGDMENYARSKRRFFSDYSISKAVINLDDELGQSIINDLKSGIITTGYSLDSELQKSFNSSIQVVTGRIINHSIDGIKMECESPWGNCLIESHLIGKFNAYNLLACVSVLGLLKIPVNEVSNRLSSIKPVPGRMELFANKAHPRIVVDYAHTPDALAQVLMTLKSYCKGKLICVFGCGGERDKGKRVLMGECAKTYADEIVLTNDNPRNEDPELIIKNILDGTGIHQHITVELDRKAAIEIAIKNAELTDIVLIAGKGHESYQEVCGIRHEFSDQAVINSLLGVGK